MYSNAELIFYRYFSKTIYVENMPLFPALTDVAFVIGNIWICQSSAFTTGKLLLMSFVIHNANKLAEKIIVCDLVFSLNLF